MEWAGRAVRWLRWLLFRVWVNLLFWRHRRLDDDAFVERVCRALERRPFWLSGAVSYRNPYRFDGMTVALVALVRHLQKRQRRPRFDVHLVGQALLEERIRSGQAAIIVTVHGPCDAAINRVLEARGLKWTLLAAAPEVVGKARLLGLEGALDVITQSKDTLLALRRKLREGRWVVADVDFASRRDRWAQLPPALSPALFELAPRVNVPLLYLWSRFQGPRVIELTFGEPGPGLGSASGEDLAIDFQRWLKVQGDLRPWRIDRWVQAGSPPGSAGLH
jgi:hypothetical protein